MENAELGASAWPLMAASPRMKALVADIRRVAGTTATVLIRGESGVGKELVARAIHVASARRSQPLIKVNCAALPAELLESELFGHERGAFTGAYRRKLGRFELAAGGTIFLDEIGELPLPLQSKLLHVLQDREFVRVGGLEVRRADVRVIAATNRDLEDAMRSGQFRSDLYYRLNVVALELPPLRERREEIPSLAMLFLRRFNAEYRRELRLRDHSLDALCRYDWPGNVRELENLIRRAVVLDNEQLVEEELRPRIAPPGFSSVRTWRETPGDLADTACIDTVRDIARQAALDAEREMLAHILRRVQWNRAEAARRLGLSYKGLLYKLNRCGLGKKRPSPGAVA